MSNNWSRFTKQAQEALGMSNNYRLKYRELEIKPEHILLVMLEQSEADAYQILSSIDFSPETMKADLERSLSKLVKSKDAISEETKYTLSSDVKNVLEHAVTAARKENLEHIGTRHLLIGIVNNQSSIASKYLVTKGVDLNKIYLSPHRTKERVLMETKVKLLYALIFTLVLVFILVNYYLF